ncbi:MAG: nucleotidyl transferase AbiEii/AbiGii toxin family protein [Planctomycetota bacterium]
MIPLDSIQDAVLSRLARDECAKDYLLRGSLLTRAWVGAQHRHADDIDLLARYPHDAERAERDLRRVLAAPGSLALDLETLHVERTWVDTDFPGLRCVATTHEGESVQIDIGFDDPVVEPLIFCALDRSDSSVGLYGAGPELSFAWKLHGLFEFDDGAWRAKDLADMDLLLRFVELDDELLVKAIQLAFESRDAPIWRLDRLLDGKFGRSAKSRQRWRRFRREHPQVAASDEHREVIERVAGRLRTLRARLGMESKPLWAANPTQLELDEFYEDRDEFARYDWDSGAATYTYEYFGKQTFLSPYGAATRKDCRRRLLAWECRGITVRGDRVLARPFPRFFPLTKLRAEEIEGATVLEKLDGSLVFPTPTEGDGWVLRTRRGRSEISEAAANHAAQSDGDYGGLVAKCIAEGLTPLFEWCSRSRIIVLDHPVDRLVLTGVRENSIGVLWTWREVSNLANSYDVSCVSRLGELQVEADLKALG